MSHRFRIPNRSSLALQKLRHELKRRKDALLSREEGTLTDALRDIFSAAGRILPRIGKPTFRPELLITDGDPDPVSWNRNLERIEEDLTTGFEEERRVRELATEVTNTALMAARELEEKANLANSRVTDLRLLAGQLDTEVIVAGDDFHDMSKVDTSWAGAMPQASVNTVHGLVTLARLDAVNVITQDAHVDIHPLLPEEIVGDAARLPGGTQEGTPEGRHGGVRYGSGRSYATGGDDPNIRRFYEGRFFAPIGEARPEGGRWHLEEKVRPGVTVAGDSRVFHIWDPSWNSSINNFFKQFPDLRRPETTVTNADGTTTKTAGDPHEVGFPLRPEDIVVLDRGAPLSELLDLRRRMIDGNPDTFWECEYVRQADALDQLVFGQTDEDGEVVDPGESELDFAQVTPQQLRDVARNDLDEADFEVAITIRLQRQETVNFLTINPMNFNETAWLEVTEVSTATDESDAFQPIEGFDANLFETVLTDEANAELTSDERSVTLAQNRYSARGTGVFLFAPRLVSRIRVKLLQRVPVPAQYERTVVQLTRTLTATQTYASGGGGGMM